MNQKELSVKERKDKLKLIHGVGGVLMAVDILLLIFPPLVHMWDRNDIWVGFMPLSQFMILALTLLSGIILMVIYFLEGRYVDESGETLQKGDE